MTTVEASTAAMAGASGKAEKGERAMAMASRPLKHGQGTRKWRPAASPCQRDAETDHERVWKPEEARRR